MRDLGVRDAIVVELDFGGFPATANPRKFTVADGRVQATSSVFMDPIGLAPTGRQADELEFEQFVVRCFPSAGSFVAVIDPAGLVAGKYKFAYVVR